MRTQIYLLFCGNRRRCTRPRFALKHFVVVAINDDLHTHVQKAPIVERNVHGCTFDFLQALYRS
ncbi:hypothetical protein DPMN_164689 [Dreissena polymorpha]|uniref:Uncharacterized protein n=1 Tax=Dreissena polymorpha TaxID=45954 RepID=A0A9D4EUN8_DREPO|nr:hypothetical protein DPMN_164689 [Dreissena polymorpha]